MRQVCLIAGLLALLSGEIYAAEQCGNSNSYVDMLCKRKSGALSSSGGVSSSSKGKFPSTPIIPDFEIQPFADEPKSGKRSPF